MGLPGAGEGAWGVLQQVRNLGLGDEPSADRQCVAAQQWEVVCADSCISRLQWWSWVQLRGTAFAGHEHSQIHLMHRHAP